jgi:hypothetical protein
MKIPEKIGAIPKAFVKLRDAINFLLDFAQIVRDAQGKNGIKILVTDQNMVIENDPDGGDEDGKGGTGGGGGSSDLEARVLALETLLEGMTRVTDTYCNSGTPDTRTILADET